jgi:predicted nucleotidyltransferase
MIATSDRDAIVRIARKYKVRRVILFGSSQHESETARDIDIAVDGVDASVFFDFYRDLIFCLSKPVDVIDLSENTRFTRLVEAKGNLIYG